MSYSVIEAKTVVIGMTGVGKTSLVLRYVSNSYNKRICPTIGASFFTSQITMDSYCVKLQVWDTAGQERFRSMTPMYYRNANAALLVYDITSRESFEELESWVQELKKNIKTELVLCVVGNKSDLAAERVVPAEEAQDFAVRFSAFHYETSASTGKGVEDVFQHLAKSLIFRCEANRDPNVIYFTGTRETPDTKSTSADEEKTITLHRDNNINQKHSTKSKCCIS